MSRRGEGWAVGGAATTVGDTVALDAREPCERQEPCDRGESQDAGKGNSVGSTSWALAFPLFDLDRSSATPSSVSSTDDSDVDEPDSRVEEEVEENMPDESEPDEQEPCWSPGLRGGCNTGGDEDEAAGATGVNSLDPVEAGLLVLLERTPACLP